jgi:hypothetical protein
MVWCLGSVAALMGCGSSGAGGRGGSDGGSGDAGGASQLPAASMWRARPTSRANRGTFTCGPKIPVGESCATDTDCVDGAYCGAVCSAFTPVGQPCSGIIVECGPAARCDAGVCQALAATGSACTDSGGCMPSDYCPPTTGVCTARIPIGGACPEAPASDADQPCADGGSCSHTSGTLLLSGDKSPLVCIPANLPVLCYTG